MNLLQSNVNRELFTVSTVFGSNTMTTSGSPPFSLTQGKSKIFNFNSSSLLPEIWSYKLAGLATIINLKLSINISTESFFSYALGSIIGYDIRHDGVIRVTNIGEYPFSDFPVKIHDHKILSNDGTLDPIYPINIDEYYLGNLEIFNTGWDRLLLQITTQVSILTHLGLCTINSASINDAISYSIECKFCQP